MLSDLSWRALHPLINQTIADMLNEQQTVDVRSLRSRLRQLAETESDELMVLCYWQASKVLQRLPATVSGEQLMQAARHAFRSPLNHELD
nr:hypothetical protein [Pantoea sp. A4]